MDRRTLPDLATVLTANAPELRDSYQAFFQQSPPKWARIDSLRGNLAWAIQANQQGHSPDTLRRRFITHSNKAT